MCLIAFAYRVGRRYPLLLVGNRDEFHARPSSPLARWDDAPQILAGRDLQAGGTWMGVSEQGKACVVTNVRIAGGQDAPNSRGQLCADFLRGADSAGDFAAHLRGSAPGYRAFNLLLFDNNASVYASNRSQAHAQSIQKGLHGLSNAALDAPWPKTRKLVAVMRRWIDAGESDDFEPLFAALADEQSAADGELPDTGVGIELERRLSPAFIRSEIYGTRASSVIAIDADCRGVFIERRFGPRGVPDGESTLTFAYGR
jgi:uncharacterized protein with NRDE domain